MMLLVPAESVNGRVVITLLFYIYISTASPHQIYLYIRDGFISV